MFVVKIVVVVYWIIGILLLFVLVFGVYMGVFGFVFGGLVVTVVYIGAFGFVIARRFDWDVEVVFVCDCYVFLMFYVVEVGYVLWFLSFVLLEFVRVNDLIC